MKNQPTTVGKFLLMDPNFSFPWQSASKEQLYPRAPHPSWTLRQELGNPSQAREAILNRNKAKPPPFEIKEIISDSLFHCIKPKELGVFRVNKMHLHFEIQCLVMSNFHRFLVVKPLNNAAEKAPKISDQRYLIYQISGRKMEGSGILCLEYGKWINGSMYNFNSI